MNRYKKKDNELAIVHKANRIMLDDVSSTIENTKQELKELRDELDKLPVDNVSVQKMDILPNENNDSSPENKSSDIVINQNQKNNIKPSPSSDWDSVVQTSKTEIESCGFDSNQISLYDLLSPEENLAIQQKLNRPMYERIPWDKWDYGFAFGAGLVGGGLDIFLGTPGFGLQEQMADKNSWIGRQMEEIHNFHNKFPYPNYKAPIDYTEAGKVGGGFHRGLTTGHDLFHPLEGIRQFMDGEFRGFYWKDGEKIFFESSVTKGGTPFQPMNWSDAVLAWMIHMFCDFFSSASLSIPGTSYVYGMDNRALRIFVEKDLYQSGINLRHITLQTIPPTAIEVIIRSYIFFRYHKQTVDPDALTQKKTELLTVAHSISAGFNIGKVIVMEDPLLINIPQLIALSKTLIQLVLQEYNRNSFFRKALRNLSDLQKTQQEYETLVNNSLSTVIVLQ